jgi:hypothetical protein
MAKPLKRPEGVFLIEVILGVEWTWPSKQENQTANLIKLVPANLAVLGHIVKFDRPHQYP